MNSLVESKKCQQKLSLANFVETITVVLVIAPGVLHTGRFS